jgi:hypothetical protein
MSVVGQLKHAWSAFRGEDENFGFVGPSYGSTSSARPPDRPTLRITSERTIISSIYTRMSIDVASVKMEHCRVDPDTDMYEGKIKSDLNNCLNVEANLDQGARHFRQDIALTMFAAGQAAIVPVDTTLNPITTGSWDVKTMRVGTITEYLPGGQDVRVRLWNENKGLFEELVLPKRIVAIVENPFYSVMNEPNSTLQRLTRKLALLDNVDEISSQGKLDLIIQFPFPVKSESRKAQAERRRQDLESQLANSTYGVAWADGTEKITQLNRSIENNLLEQIKFLEEKLYTELGLTPGVMNGTADDAEMLNYTNRTIEPVMDAITEAMARKFLTKTARSQGQTIRYFDTPFKLIPISQLADLVDSLSRNQIVSPNEIRPAIGLKPRPEPQANALVNSNMPLEDQITGDEVAVEEGPNPADEAEDELDAQMAELGLG